jgi:hypothetical protein
MIESVELRGFADDPMFALFPPDEGQLIGSGIRKVVIRGDDP